MNHLTEFFHTTYTGLVNGSKPFVTTVVASNISGNVMHYPNPEFIAGFLVVTGSLTGHIGYFLLKSCSKHFRQFSDWLEHNTDERTKQNIFYMVNGLDKILTRAGNAWAATDAMQLFVNTTLEQTNSDFEIPAELQRWLRPSIYFAISFMVLIDHLTNTHLPRYNLSNDERTALINDVETNSAEYPSAVTCSLFHHGLAFLENKIVGNFGFIWFILSFTVMCLPPTIDLDVLPPYTKIIASILGTALLSCINMQEAPAPASHLANTIS